MRTIQEIISDMARLATEAYDLGKDDAASKLRSDLATFLGAAQPKPPPQVTVRAISLNGMPVGGRNDSAPLEKAQMGTVKPGIIQLINHSPKGLTQDEIIEKTGFKSNSVRGTLYAIVKERLAERRQGRYYPAGQFARDRADFLSDLGADSDEGSDRIPSEPS